MDKRDLNGIFRYEPKTSRWSLIPCRLTLLAFRFAGFAVNRTDCIS